MPPPITGKLHKNTMVAGKLGFEAIVTVLNQGSPVILGLVITDAFYGPNDVGVIVDKNPDIERGGHAVLAVGHGTGSATDPALLIRNSWGQDWGLGGYAWLSRGYLARQLHETATLT
jgi:C1A family cysteine protease